VEPEIISGSRTAGCRWHHLCDIWSDSFGKNKLCSNRIPRSYSGCYPWASNIGAWHCKGYKDGEDGPLPSEHQLSIDDYFHVLQNKISKQANDETHNANRGCHSPFRIRKLFSQHCGIRIHVVSGFGGTWNVIGSLKGFFLIVSITA
jgi:hypothetical protein